MAEPILIAKQGSTEVFLLPGMANRHGCITGATGTGKTVTLQVLAEAFSAQGIPVFLADVKGDLTGLTQAGASSPKMTARLESLGFEEPEWRASPATLWDVFGDQGHPVRATVSDMGPLLLARMLNLNDTQAGVLTMVFRIADDSGMLLLDMKDLRAMLQYVGDNGAQFKTRYGNVSAASVGAIQRGLLSLEEQGGDRFFGEPMLNVDDLMQTDAQGRGIINILAADKLMQAPTLYATFLLWLLSELYEHLPEAGDTDKPRFVFFFDEAHLLFKDAPKALLDKIEQVVRLIRSKAVGVYFVTQNPLDIPDTVLGQLGNRIQHALRAFTPRDQKAVKSAADTMRPNPGLDIGAAITELGVGEALVSVLDEKGRPCPTERVYIVPPASRIGQATAAEREAVRASSLVAGVYEKAVDRESAYELLTQRAETSSEAANAPPVSNQPSGTPTPPWTGDAAGRSAGTSASTSSGTSTGPLPTPTAGGSAGAPSGGMMDGLRDVLFGTTGPRGGRHPGMLESVAKSAARSVGSQVAREITRGLLGSLLGGRKKR